MPIPAAVAHNLASEDHVITKGRFLMLASVLVIPTLEAQTIRYMPGSARYEQTVVTTSATDILGTGSGMDIRQSMIMSTKLTAAGADSLLFDVTIDSSSLSGGGGVIGRNGQLVEPGARFSTKINHYGHASRAASTVNSTTGLAAGILPGLMRGARLGSVWSDTVPLSSLGVGGVTAGLDGTILRTVSITADTTFEGEPAWKLESGSEVKVAAAGQASNTRIPANITGSGTGVAFLSKTGVLLSSSETLAVNVSVNLGGRGSFALESNVVRTLKRLK